MAAIIPIPAVTDNCDQRMSAFRGGCRASVKVDAGPGTAYHRRSATRPRSIELRPSHLSLLPFGLAVLLAACATPGPPPVAPVPEVATPAPAPAEPVAEAPPVAAMPLGAAA
jgi:hypothetical protein